MRKADFKARVKKIEIVNRVLTDGWAQSIRVVLEDIDLTNEKPLGAKAVQAESRTWWWRLPPVKCEPD
ncbi:MAG: hypothetical protein RJR37_14195 [Peptococcaceae bacterium MAG4]|nr:hypothetical protein [Peptococcaceae bacterium MAG4]